jgi:hypothetical protein
MTIILRRPKSDKVIASATKQSRPSFAQRPIEIAASPMAPRNDNIRGPRYSLFPLTWLYYDFKALTSFARPLSSAMCRK